MELYLENLKPNVKSATYYTATHEIKSAFKYIPSSVLFADIATNDLTRLAQGYSVEYCQSKLRLSRLQAVFNYAELEGIIEINPFSKFKQPKQKKKKVEYPLWTIENLKDFLDVCKTKPPIVYPAFRFLAYSGMREGELTALKWSDLDGNLLTISRTMTKDYSGRFVICENTKTTGSQRAIALDDETLTILED